MTEAALEKEQTIPVTVRIPVAIRDEIQRKTNIRIQEEIHRGGDSKPTATFSSMMIEVLAAGLEGSRQEPG